jgi:FemAB-related protein (PEP-CTERM system-associated)
VSAISQSSIREAPDRVDRRPLEVRVVDRRDLPGRYSSWERELTRNGPFPLSRHPGWLTILERGMRHVPYCFEAVQNGELRGILPLAFVRSMLFGRYLVSLPYVNYGGVCGDTEAAGPLIDQAIGLADRLRVRFLELRHEQPVAHARLVGRPGLKVHMRRPLPATADLLWSALSPKVRNQVRKGQKSGLSVSWGGEERLDEFYEVFSRNMRDLGTPVFGRSLFRAVLHQFPDRAEFCVVRAGDQPAAAALLLNGWGITEVPSASSLRQFNPTCANMLMYFHLLERAIARGQLIFDFGRSTPDGSTFQFKKQWGAAPEPAEWQYYLRDGDAGGMRPDNPRYRRLIELWQRLPVGLTRVIGPPIVRGIP